MTFTLIGFSNINPTLHFWDKTQMVILHSPFFILVGLTCENFVKFCIHVHEIYSILCFLKCFFLVFYHINACLTDLGNVPSSSVFWNSLCRNTSISSLNIWLEKFSGQGFFFVRRDLTINVMCC